MASKEDYQDLITSATMAGGISLAASVVRHIILERHGGWRPLLRGMLASALVAIFVGWGLFAVTLPFPVQMAIVGICAYLGDDILLGVMVIGRMVRNDPTSFLSTLLSTIRGRASKSSDSSGKKD